MIHLRPALCVTILVASLVALAGCGASGDNFDTPNVDHPFTTTVTLTPASVTLNGPVTSGTVTADVVTVESGDGTAPAVAPTQATIANGTWTYAISNGSGKALTTQKVLIRWFQKGLQIDQEVVAITL